MSTDIEKAMELAADAAAGAISSLKRKTFDGENADEPQSKTFKPETPPQTSAPPQPLPQPPQTAVPQVHLKTEAASDSKSDASTKQKPTYTRVREIRLDQNRKAARESRRRKKLMIEELQRSVIFFSRANSALKQQNEDLTRMLMQAQTQVSTQGTSSSSDEKVVAVAPVSQQQPVVLPQPELSNHEISSEQAQAQAVATQAIFESQGFPAAAARAAAQTMNASLATPSAPSNQATAASSAQLSIPSMTPGATMQAMANFQQAAAAAMQAAMQGMQGIPGVNLSQLAATPAGANAQQAYTDTMTALAMQQAAAAAGHQFMMQQPGMQGLMPYPMMVWPQQQVPQAPPANNPATTATDQVQRES